MRAQVLFRQFLLIERGGNFSRALLQKVGIKNSIEVNNIKKIRPSKNDALNQETGPKYD